MRVVVGSRGSPLALTQTQETIRVLRRRHPDVEFLVKEVRTQGDRAGEAPLAKMPRGLFAKELEVALSRGDIDMAVHSFKDLTTDLAPGFSIAAISRREDPRDVLVTPDKRTLERLPKGSRLGTSSPRRLAQIKAYRPDLEVLPIRGNVGTRIEKARGADYDGVVLAAAGVRRLGLEEQVSEYIPPEICLPAVGQGALAIEIRADDEPMRKIAVAADHPESHAVVAAEMGVLQRLGGGCKVPIAAYARLDGDELYLMGMVASAAGEKIVRAGTSAPASQPEEAGFLLAQTLLDKGAGALLEEER